MLAGAVESARREPEQSRPRRDLDNAPALTGRVLLPEEPDRLLQDVCRAPEVHVKQRPSGVVGRALDLSEHDVPRVADDDVDAAEDLLRLLERGDDVAVDGHVDLEDEEAVGRVFGLEIGEHLGPAERSDGDVALVQHGAGHVQTEAGGAASDCESSCEIPSLHTS